MIVVQDTNFLIAAVAKFHIPYIHITYITRYDSHRRSAWCHLGYHYSFRAAVVGLMHAIFDRVLDVRF